jgi:hypothetical protein
MATTWQINGVRLERPPDHRYGHITHVRIAHASGDFILSRETVITDLEQRYGDRYYTYAGGLRAEVIVVDCPACGRGDYITTEPDDTTENNLLDLPRV